MGGEEGGQRAKRARQERTVVSLQGETTWGRAEVAQAWGRLLRVRDMNLSLLLDSQEN